MVDEPENLILQLLREMRADMTAMKQDVAAIKAAQETHGKIQAMHAEALECTTGLLYLMRGKAV